MQQDSKDKRYEVVILVLRTEGKKLRKINGVEDDKIKSLSEILVEAQK
jgi:hypothetical protein